MEEILARASKVADHAEVYYISSEETSVTFEANRLKHMESKQINSVAVRIVKDGRIGYATGNQLGSGPELVQNALETAQFGAQARFELPGRTEYPRLEIIDPAVESVATEQMIRLGEQIIAAVTGHTPGILCEGGVDKGRVSVRIINSQGGQAGYEKTFFSAGMEGTLVKGTDMLFVGENQSSCHPIADVKPISDEVIRQLELAKENVTVATKTMPVIFTPNGVAAALVMPLVAAFNGKTVFEGASPLGNRLGEVVFDERLSLWDDATVPYRPGSRPCDDEGMPSRRTALIENGRVANFYYDLQTAGRAGKRSTGNGVRGHGAQPSPAPNALVITPGEATFEEMVRDIKEGLVIEQLIGAGMGNILGGDFAGNVLLGYKIENGRIAGRVKDTIVNGNVYQVLKDVVGLGRETKWVGSFLQSPHIYCRALSVAAKSR